MSSASTQSPMSGQDTPATSRESAGDDNEVKTEDGVSQAMQKEEEAMLRKREKEDSNYAERMQKERAKDLAGGIGEVDKKFKALEYLLNQSKLYSTIMLKQMQKQEAKDEARTEKDKKKAEKIEQKAEQAAEESQRRATRSAPNATSSAQEDGEPDRFSKRGRGRATKNPPKLNKITSYIKKEDVEAKAGTGTVSEALQEAAGAEVKSGEIGIQNLQSARQPDLVTGGNMRTYQLEGLEWLISLYENGLNGILADEMGLGKTVQTISFLAFLREKKSYGPFLIVAPLSTTTNWINEFKRWTPDIPAVLYHGSKQDREKIRRTQLKNPGSEKYPVVVTSYEICMNDRKFLANFGWKFIIIDEGHRIKNINCRLIRELQQYRSANRLLITGTPLQNNLTELWSLLHFLMPEIFDKLEAFESWFDFSELKDKQGYEQMLSEDRQQQLVASLHAILKPFLLRRVKGDVEKLLPKKREYVLYAPLTSMQRELYQAILDGTSRSYLEDKVVERLSMSRSATPNSVRSSSVSLKRKAPPGGSRLATPSKSAKVSRDSTPAASVNGSVTRSTRGTKRRNYNEENDTKYFKKIGILKNDKDFIDDDSEPEEQTATSEDEEDRMMASNLEIAKQQVRQKKLANPVMQLRLCCNHPYNFYNPFHIDAIAADEQEKNGVVANDYAEQEIGEPDETLVTTSGKMLLLDSLLPALFEGGHKVLIFSQFKLQLDLLEDYAALRKWKTCRIDGTMAQTDRQAQIDAFNKPPKATPKKPAKKPTKQKSRSTADDMEVDDDDDEPVNLFLLSTRAGGQGINLAAADTVILFDSDWNPQQDLQAQDRAHRIGQTRNVIIYRLATRNTVEQTLLETAEGKRRLEKLVIRKGGINRSSNNGPSKDNMSKDEFEELQALLRKSDGDVFELDDRSGKLLSDEELKILIDRSDEAYVRASKGMDEVEGGMFKAVEMKSDTGILQSLSKT